MWLFETTNGGRYRHLRANWSPAPEFCNLIDSLMANNVKFEVFFNEYELEGWHHDVFLINDETLEEIRVDHHIAWEHYGQAFYGIKVLGDQWYDTRTLWSSKEGNVFSKLASQLNECVNSTTLCLPSPDEVKMYSLAKQLLEAAKFMYYSYTAPKLLDSGTYTVDELKELPKHCSYEYCLEYIKEEHRAYPNSWVNLVEISIRSRMSHPTWEEEKAMAIEEDDVIL